ncbi:MAG TPA: 16S rRNA (cytidine(1402)-2'-O)-methyltransferase [Azospirillum sp.]|nr:16S rRNA (cytidine(1402)-2'-O)-methyltransferase [Azospirillum sp.]
MQGKLAPGLHVVATPIGNAADITLRALDTLKRADAVACEDTRVTGKLMMIHGVSTPLVSYHEHNAARMRPVLIERMRAGEAVALVSDAGTPLVSDPGYKLVRECVAAGVGVTALPGPSAPLTALVLSGLPTDRFLFAGFLPNKQAARRGAIGELRGVPATLVFFESAQRLPDTLADLADLLGEREAAVARELTKLYEEVRRGPLPELAAHYAEAGPPKGEVVLVVGPPGAEAEMGEADMDAALAEALGRLSVRDAAAEVAARTGRAKREVYARALELAREGTHGGPRR